MSFRLFYFVDSYTRETYLDNERSNRILLVLAFVLALLVFMDFQARRHYQSQLGFDEGGVGDTLEEARTQTRAVTESLTKPIRASADAILGRSRSLVQDGVEGAALEIEHGKGKAKRKLHEILKQNLDNRGEPPSSELYIEPVPQSVSLYFIRFRQGRSELVRVKRRVNQKRLSYLDVLRMLKKGPNIREHGLINAFGSHVKIYGVYPEKDRLIVDLGKGMERMGRHVIQDRLDQLVLTLTQFDDYKQIELWIDGRPVRSLGRDKVPVASRLRPSRRRVFDLEQN